MSRKHYHPQADNTLTGWTHTEQPSEHTDDTAQPDRITDTNRTDHPSAGGFRLQPVVEGILSGASPLQFMDSIDAGSKLLGNRGLLHLVGRLKSGEQERGVRAMAERGLQGPGCPLTHLEQLQQAFGHHDIRGMREHTGTAAGKALAGLGAQGYTSDGRMALAGPPDLYVQAHEAAHGVQQAALSDRLPLVGSSGDRYERQADAVADAVVRGESAQPLLDSMAGRPTQVAPGSGNGAVQMKWPDRNLEDLTMEEFEAAIREMTDTELDQAWEELTLLLEIAELEEQESEPKRKGGKKEKKARAKPTSQQAQAGEATAGATAAPGKQRQKKQQKAPAEKGRAKAAPQKAGKLTLDTMPGMQDMFLARAVNHLISGELYRLDSMVGDEGCQLRTPFTLDMYDLVQEQLKDWPYGSSATDIVGEYREAAGSEQTAVIARMKEIEMMRTGSDAKDLQAYENAVSEFIASNALQASIAAKSGPYEELFNLLITAMEQYWPGATQYLEYLLSESLFWGSLIDPFGVSMVTFKEPIFPDSILARRKVAQAELCKDYFVKALTDLLTASGIGVQEKQVVAGYSKKGPEGRMFNMPASNPESILSMLLYSIQLCTASIPAKNKDLPLIQCWESLRSLMSIMLAKQRPVIINLTRLVSSGPEDDPVYRSDLSETLFYEPTPDGYRYQPNPDMKQQRQGAFTITGFSMLREGDDKINTAGLKTAPWLFEEDPGRFLEGFTSADLPNLIFLGGIKHPPLNVGAAGAKALALTSEESERCTNKTRTRDFGRSSEKSFPYAEELHRKVLEDLGQTGMTEAGQLWLTPDYRLTEAAKKLAFPDQCPIDITRSRPGSAMNIAEEFQLLLRLAEAANLESVRYSMESRDNPDEVLRLANRTIPFSIKHIFSSNYLKEKMLSRQYAAAGKGVKRGKRHKMSELSRHEY